MKRLGRLILIIFLIFLISSFLILNKLSYVDSDGSDKRPSLNIRSCDSEIQLIKAYELEFLNLQSQIKQLHDLLSVVNISHYYGNWNITKLNQTYLMNKPNRHPENIQTPFTYFNLWHQYPMTANSFGHSVGEKLNGLLRIQIDLALDAAVSSMNKDNSRESYSWRRDQFIEGIYRRSPSIGTHYDLTFVNDEHQMKRVSLFQSETSPVVTDHRVIGYQKKLYLIVPLSSSKRDSLHHFLDNLESILSKRHHDIYLILVYFGQPIKDLMTIFQPFILKHNFKSYKIKHIVGSNFTRGAALDAGIRAIEQKADSLMFLCDVDVIFREDFIRRCVSYTEAKRSVYYPILFSLYNPELIEFYYNQKFPSWKEQMKQTPDHGFWRDFGYGMVCLYRSDYLSVGGFNKNITGWGDEDVQLYKKFAHSNLTVYRSADPGIYHLWHVKTCDKSLSDEQYQECLRSKILNEGNQMQLGYLYFQNEIELKKHNREHL